MHTYFLSCCMYSIVFVEYQLWKLIETIVFITDANQDSLRDH